MTLDFSSLAPSLAFALMGAAIAVALGGTLGSVAATVDIPGRRSAIATATALLAAPPAFWWIGLTRLSVRVGGASGLASGSVMAGLALAPITMLLVLAAAQEVPANGYAAARLSLAPPRRVWFVLIPLLRPAMTAGFLLTAILLLGESEIPFLFGFRTSMTDVVTIFAQTFDAGRTLPSIVPLVLTVAALALLMVRPLFQVLLPAATGGRGIVRRARGRFVAPLLVMLPAIVALSLVSYVRAAASSASGTLARLAPNASVLAISIAEPILCAFVAVVFAVVLGYPLRRSVFIRWLAVAGLVLFCVPTGVTAIGWIALGQRLGGVPIPPPVAYISRMVGVSILGFLVAYARVPRSLEDAARLLPVSSVRRAWVFILPLVFPSLAATAALISALIFSDRDVASLLLPPGASRLMLNLYLLSANAPSGAVGVTALVVFTAGTVVIVLAASGPLLLGVRRRDE